MKTVYIKRLEIDGTYCIRGRDQQASRLNQRCQRLGRLDSKRTEIWDFLLPPCLDCGGKVTWVLDAKPANVCACNQCGSIWETIVREPGEAVYNINQ